MLWSLAWVAGFWDQGPPRPAVSNKGRRNVHTASAFGKLLPGQARRCRSVASLLNTKHACGEIDERVERAPRRDFPIFTPTLPCGLAGPTTPSGSRDMLGATTRRERQSIEHPNLPRTQILPHKNSPAQKFSRTQTLIMSAHLAPTSPGPLRHVSSEALSSSRLLLLSLLRHRRRSSRALATSPGVSSGSPTCSTLA